MCLLKCEAVKAGHRHVDFMMLKGQKLLDSPTSAYPLKAMVAESNRISPENLNLNRYKKCKLHFESVFRH